jgi:peptidyl-prolyl cis-trans isomerase C
MSKQSFQTKSFYGLAVAALMMLSGCDFCCKKKSCSTSSSGASMPDANDTSAVLLTIGGKPVVTENQFLAYYDQFIASNPRLQGMIQFLPNAKQEIFKGMANEEIVMHWAEQNDVASSADYQKELDQAVKMIKRGLAAKRFEQTVVGKVTVTEAEMKDYYEKHKNPELIVAPGGIKALGVEFDSKAQAQAFLAKVTPANFKSAAEAEKRKIREFAPINEFSFDIDKNVKDKVAAVKTFPSVLVVEASDKKCWVVDAISKEETKYRSFDEVREGLKAVIEREKMAKIWTDKIDELKKQYDVTEDTAYFEKAAQVPAGQMPISQEDLAAFVEQQQAQQAASTPGA